MSTSPPTSNRTKKVDLPSSDSILKSDTATSTSRFCDELCQPMFHLLEPNGKEIDVKRSFAPKPTMPMMMAKVVFFVWTLATIVTDTILYFKNRYFSLAYLTQWALILTLAYQMLSILALVQLSKLESSTANSSLPRTTKNRYLHWLIRSVWCLFSIASTLEVVVVFSYWLMRIVGFGTAPLTYSNIMTHGGVALLVLIDGLVLNRTPLRVKQAIFPMIVGTFYALWTVLHWRLEIGNPEEEFDTIYPPIDWENDKMFSLIQCALVIDVLIPLAFLCIRMISLWSGRLNFDGTLRHTVSKEDLENSNIITSNEEFDIEINLLSESG